MRYRRVITLGLSLVCFFSAGSSYGQSQSQSQPRPFELTPYGAFSIGGEFSDTDLDITASLDDSESFGLLFNIRAEANTQWEILYSKQNTSATFKGAQSPTQDIDIDAHYLQAGGTYLGDGKAARPYLAATIGATHFDVSTPGFNSDSFFSFSIGTGLQVRPHDRLGLRLEARVFGTFVQSDSKLFCLSNPGNMMAGCAITVSGEVLWQAQAMAGLVFRF